MVPISKTHFLRHFASPRLHQHHQYHQHRRHYIINMETIIVITGNTNLGLDIFVQNQRKELGYLSFKTSSHILIQKLTITITDILYKDRKTNLKPLSFKSLYSIKLIQKLTIIPTITVSGRCI